jgi:hypothetical protein
VSLAAGRAGAVGVLAALETPRWLHGQRWRTLLDETPAPPAPAAAPPLALRSALLALRLLSRLPGRRWRNTCLFRSVAECLVLRRYGVDARLRIGVGREVDGPDGIVAHAWVVRPGQADAAADPRAAALRVLDGPA